MRESVESMERNGRMTMGNRPCGRNAIFKCVAIIATVVTLSLIHI